MMGEMCRRQRLYLPGYIAVKNRGTAMHLHTDNLTVARIKSAQLRHCLVPGFSSVITSTRLLIQSVYAHEWLASESRTCGGNMFTAAAWVFKYDVMTK